MALEESERTYRPAPPFCGCGGRRGARRSSAARSEDSAELVAREQRRFMDRAAFYGVVVVISLAVWLISGAGPFWPIWVILFAAVMLGLGARRVYGARSEIDV
jgi:hypothetical protein